MNKKYDIKYSELFYNDLISILDYIRYELENPIAAQNLFDEIMQEILNRSYNPEIYEKYTSIRKRENVYYRIYINNYTVFYIVKDDIMIVRRILYSKRNIKNII